MAKRVNKRFQELLKKIDKEKKYSVDEALANIKNLASAKFDETIEVALKLNESGSGLHRWIQNLQTNILST